MTSDIVVIGGGMAGARLSRQLTGATSASVTVIGEEPHAPYNRVLLAEVLAGRYAAEVIELPEPDPRCTVRRGVRVVRIDREERRVHCDDGSVVPYGRLVLATGSNPVLPPLRGLFNEDGGELPEGVHAFRTMDDCIALGAAVTTGMRAVVIGGGLLGVSAARALAERGAQVILAQQGEHLMERQLDEQAARLVRAHLESLGVEVHTECRVRGLRCDSGDEHVSPAVPRSASAEEPTATATSTGTATGTGTRTRTTAAERLTAMIRATHHQGEHTHRVVRAVELADGYELAADLVVIACGVRPRVGLAQATGLDVKRGIVVDDELRTSDPYVFAIGDCAEHDGTTYGLAGPALEQADVLAQVLAVEVEAEALAEAAPRYTGTRALTRLTLAGNTTAHLDLAAFGETVPQPGDDVVHLSDATRKAYRKVVVRGDRLVGGVLLGDLATVGALARAWEGDEPLPSAPLLHLLTDNGGF